MRKKMDFSNGLLSRLSPVATALLLFFAVSALYFAPQFRGETLPQHDVLQYEGMTHDIRRARAETGEDPQWTGGMFGGMPAYLINVAYPAQLVNGPSARSCASSTRRPLSSSSPWRPCG